MAMCRTGKMTRWRCWAPQQPPTAWQHLASRPWGSKRLPHSCSQWI
jgi:hypothetical protein